MIDNFMEFDDGCGRYALKTNPDELKKRYNLAKKPPEFPKSFDVKPGQTLPVITASEDGKPQFEMMKWGLVPFWAKDPKIGYSTFNARDDTVFTKPMWRSIYRTRALIPATGYFEWTKPSTKDIPKQKYYFRPKGSDVFSFAGFYDIWRDVENRELMTYTLITTQPNKEAAAIHDRMPVILRREDESPWLEPSRTKREDIEPFLLPLEDNSLEVVEVGVDVKEYAYDDEHIIAPLNSQ